MMDKKSLISKYYNLGYLNQRYYIDGQYYQPYSAEDRLQAATVFYGDYLLWRNGRVKSIDASIPKVDGGVMSGLDLTIGFDRFRRALRCVSKVYLGVVYKIVIEEKNIKPKANMSSREKLYFSDEIKTLLCRGLDELVSYYKI